MNLTFKQRQVYGYLYDYIQEHGYSPTIKETCRAVGSSSPSTVHHHLTALEDAGFVRRTPHVSRGIELTQRFPRKLQVPEVPLAEQPDILSVLIRIADSLERMQEKR